MDRQKAYDDFPVNEKMIWLNNCGTTSPNIQVKEAIDAYLTDFLQKGIYQSAAPMAAVKKNIQAILSRLLNCRPEEIALIHNTNEGMMYLSGGLDLKSGDEILLLENEYPSNVYPWERWKESGVAIRFIPLGTDPKSQLQNIKDSVTARTKVISLSAVHWCTGLPLPLEETGRLCADKGIWFFVDGAQGVGHVKIDFQAIGADALCFSCWKWLLGPLGLGVLVLKNASAEKLKFPFKGCDSVIDEQKYLPYRDTLKSGAARYMTSTAPYIEWLYFGTMLEYLDKIGFDAVMQRIFFLSGILERGLEELGFEVLSAKFKPALTGIICSRHPEIPAGVLVGKLQEKNIIARERSGYLRLAPHFYQSQSQMEETLSQIKAITAGR